jgi:aspartate/methionine/tyrosine aminotransferase
VTANEPKGLEFSPEHYLAERSGKLGTEGAFEVLRQARLLEAQGRSVVHFEIGEPDFDTAPHIVEAAVKALHNGYTHYGPANGLPELREAVARELAQTRRLEWADPENVIVTPGAKPVLFYTILALVNEGDEVIYPDPGFPIYRSMIDYVGGKGVPIPLRVEREFRLDPAELESLVTPRTQLLIINSPQNPTGSVLHAQDLDHIAEIANRHDLVVLSDEIYSRLLYRGTHESIAARPGMAARTIVLDGFSKSYAMTGWRLGYGLVPGWLTQTMTRLMVNSNSCTASFTQMAGVAALEAPQTCVETMLAEFTQRREVVVAGLNKLPGVSCAPPQGAFYAFPDIRGTGYSSRELAGKLLYEGGVAVLAGSSFGEAGEGFLRLSYANSLANLREGLARMKQVLEA